MRFANQAFRNETITLDGNEYVECSFSNCKFQYSGGEFNISKIVFDTMEFTVDGPAARTVLLLRSLWANPAGRQAVLGLLDPAQPSTRQP
jgi:hypothetical protein